MKGVIMPRLIERIRKTGNRPPALVRAAVGLVLTALIVGVALAWPSVGSHNFTGEIQDSNCAATAEHVEKECALTCVRHGAKWVLYDPLKDEVYQLDDQDMPAKFAAQKVTITGTFDKSTKTIHVVKTTGA
jgi:hypothetical protein